MKRNIETLTKKKVQKIIKKYIKTPLVCTPMTKDAQVKSHPEKNQQQ